MKLKLGYKLTLSYALVAIISVLTVALLANSLIQNHFRQYVLLKGESANKSIVNDLERSYKDFGKWDLSSVQDIGSEALDNGYIVGVKNNGKEEIWDAHEYDLYRCGNVIHNMSEHMRMNFPTWKENYTVKNYDITVDDKLVGTVSIGSFPDYYSENDVLYLKTLNKVLIYSSFIALVAAIIVGFLVTNNIVRPISKVEKITKNISKGNYNQRIDEKVDTVELDNLIISINDLAKSLQKQEDIRKNLTKDVSHELKTPLTSLQITLEAFIDGIIEPTKERFSVCYEEILRLNRLVKDLEKLYSYEQDHSDINKTKFNMGEIVQNIITNFESEYKMKNITVSFSNDNLTLNADKDKITQVIINLLSNAIKYTNEGGNIEIRLFEHKTGIKLIVKDNGVGIPDEDKEYIFERFYRVDKSRTRLTGGAGIGLSIVKAIVDSHNGTIDVESKEGKGTIFSVYISN
ncbi:sensor histidine kinase [Asaccharospora irregularis]|uniref:histidine kinase n=1 Tax=Asaccharospora irregularis DSM 2635 TaxID=1121321 RepID=A0A1M5T8W5_9FIRM|nr:HAMP domain-containing sensor histidine kinase [Asaccharospora irregularis]SHH47161.1 Signal transduction histidine kinase [Asaccharospora irregularis DSM 2635]